jgi:class 3 adenylate cyclase
MLNYLSAKPKQNGFFGHGSSNFCTTCGYQSPVDAPLCLNCSVPLGVSCPACQHPLAAGSKFCPECGTPLLSTMSQPQMDGGRRLRVLNNVKALIPKPLAAKMSVRPHAIFGERREVTIVDLRFTDPHGLSRPFADETLFFLKDEILQVVTSIIEAYEGTIDKSTVGGLVALFGAPVAHENDPERAIRAALDIQTALQPCQARFMQEVGLAFEVTMGIHTGFVVAGVVGNKLHMDYTIIGKSTNLAQTLQEAASPGTIFVSQETCQQVWSKFEFRAGAPLPVEGHSALLQPFQPLRILDNSPGNWLNTPMIGRAGDLRRLTNAFSEVRQLRQSRIVLVSGEAGMGKSRLVAEFRQTVSPTDANVYQGECVTYARSTPLWVVASLLRDALNLVETDQPAVQRQMLQTRLEALKLTGSDIIHYLAYCLGLGSIETEAGTQPELLDAAMLQRQTTVPCAKFF